MWNIGKTVKEKRHQRGLSQVELADRSGLHVRNIKRLEKGPCAVTSTTLEALAKALGCPVVELIPAARRKSA